MQVFENRQNTELVKTMAMVHAVQDTDQIEDIMQELIDSLFPYHEEEREEQVQQAMDMFESEIGRKIEIQEADY